MIKTFESLFGSFKGLTDQVKEYINTKVAILKLEFAKKVSLFISNAIAIVMSSIVFVFFVLFVSVAGALAISAWIGKPYSGFLIVAGFYLLIGIITWSNREKMIRKPILNSIIKEMFKDDNTN